MKLTPRSPSPSPSSPAEPSVVVVYEDGEAVDEGGVVGVLPPRPPAVNEAVVVAWKRGKRKFSFITCGRLEVSDKSIPL